MASWVSKWHNYPRHQKIERDRTKIKRATVENVPARGARGPFCKFGLLGTTRIWVIILTILFTMTFQTVRFIELICLYNSRVSAGSPS